jgi:uncharacterized protein (TIGR03083 family)
VDASSSGPVLAEAARRRSADVVAALAAAEPGALDRSSSLAGWTRLTLVCHLRYGAVASQRLTTDALAGRPTSFYPGGRSRQRPDTLRPGESEAPADVVGSLATQSGRLQELWARLAPPQWETVVEEPAANPDLGRTTIDLVAMMRLTEVEVHGGDLDVGLDDWSDVFVAHALPVRLRWLTTRRSNHRAVDTAVIGSWLFATTDGPGSVIATDGRTVTVQAAGHKTTADAVIEGSSRDLLALLLGRPPRQVLTFGGDTELARAFTRAFPGP